MISSQFWLISGVEIGGGGGESIYYEIWGGGGGSMAPLVPLPSYA